MDFSTLKIENAFYDFAQKFNNGFFIIDFKENKVFRNDNIREIIDTSDNEFSDLNLLQEYIYDDDRKKFLEHREIVFKNGKNECEFRIINQTQEIIWVRERCAVMEYDANNKPLILSGSLRDITASKQENIKKAMKYFADVNKFNSLGEYEIDILNKKIFFTNELSDFLGYTSEDLNGDLVKLSDKFSKEEFERLLGNIEKYVSGDTTSYLKVGYYMYNKKARNTNFIYTMTYVSTYSADGKPLILKGDVVDIESMVKFRENFTNEFLKSQADIEVLKTDVKNRSRTLNFFVDMTTEMLNACPHICLLLDEKLNIIDCNTKAVEIFNFDGKDDVKKNLWEYIKNSVTEELPNGKKTGNILENYKSVLNGEQNDVSFDTNLVIDNDLRYYTVSIKRINFGDDLRIVSYITDTTDINIAKAKVENRENLLVTTSEIANIHMSSEVNSLEEFESITRNCLKTIAKSVGGHCISIWENYIDNNGNLCAKRLYGWNSSHKEDYKVGEITIEYEKTIPEWNSTTDNNFKIINTYPKFLSKNIQEIDNIGRAASIILIPIKMQSDFWGFLGLAHAPKPYFFDETEKQILLSAAMINVSAVIRYNLLKNITIEKENALRAARAKTDFLSRMSHEIRTPINAVIGMNLLARKCTNIANVNYYLDRIDQASNQLLGIINDVLDMSKIDADKLEINHSEFNFSQMLEKIINTVQVKIDEKAQQFDIDLEKAFRKNMISDQLRLTQVILNILNNACKFTPEGGKISLKVREEVIDDEKSKIIIDISDTGIGIPSEIQSKIFDAFEQGDGGVVRRFGGTGLGLSICRKIVELMGGTISVTSEVGNGSVFSFNFITKWGNECSYFQKAKKYRNLTKLLIIDDSDFMLKYLRNLFKSYKMRCDIASSGEEAISLTKLALSINEPYNIIFCDWYMPKMSGVETIKKLKQIIDKSCNIVVISAEEWTKINDEAAALGVYEHLSKPILPSVLYSKLAELVKTDDTDDETEIFEFDDYSGKRILIVDDNEINREIIKGILGDTGVTFEQAVNGEEAVQIFKDHSIALDLIIMDVQMPILDGLSATKQIRELDIPYAAQIPIVAMTANAFNEDKVLCLKAGMDDYIAKPIDVKKLQLILKKYLG
ncbi:MAG: response regulator [Oscillospiraceae bacterium]|jgi:signal transduction histidine kinase/CheY-like chemotaxis protein/PAS domain-containing protein|nr:response regulator [Oscillospiraceae bacterium]